MGDGPPWRIGIVGLGFGSRLMLPFLGADPRARVVAAADPRADARSAFEAEFRGTTYEAAEGLLAAPDVDIVYIATPTHLHRAHVVEAAGRGKHIVVEKPLAPTVQDAQRIGEAVQRAGVHLVCGHTHGFDGWVIAMRDLVASGELGRLRSILTWNANEYLVRPRAAWDLRTELGGGVVFNQAPHQIEIVRTVAGVPLRTVRGRVRVGDARRPTEGGYTAYLELTDGTPISAIFGGFGFFDTAELFGYWRGERGDARHPGAHADAWAEYATGESRTAEDEDRVRDRLRYGDRAGSDDPDGWTASPFFGFTMVSGDRGDVRQTPTGLQVYSQAGSRHIDIPSRYADAAGAVVTELLDALEFGTAPSHGVEWATATVEVCEALLRASASGDEVALTHQQPSPDLPGSRQ